MDSVFVTVQNWKQLLPCRKIHLPRERRLTGVSGCERQRVFVWALVVIKAFITCYNTCRAIHKKLRRDLTKEIHPKHLLN